ncbi:VIT1/CCC1 family predicted Fe2+/Mn2+ transporter [Silvibacterium bohemicum]|uniref:VIT1/CCC1 family predicted Fe2+/Mn2+ transporter n=1 Tax=Silvibacterium bohemicum TaxID=1577686 RepID=A0A841JPS5_9BACT|nr:hypothetical protein [Silvibacterium bohemicum]MBB6142425.1 VIT1/CCC1 family predicted Fe2+/Mn2+ transporter [Silvibacterium bohemicum]
MPSIAKTFFAYPSSPPEITAVVEQVVSNFKMAGVDSVESWRQLDVAGHFIADQILNKIDEVEVFVADITQLNFNVAYEVGYALAQGKRVVLTRHKGIQQLDPLIKDVGIFDTIGWKEYQNSNELEAALRDITDFSPSIKSVYPLNRRAPVYLIAARIRTDQVTRIISRVKKARLFFRQFDPAESPRLSATQAFEQVSQSFGVLLHLLPDRFTDASIHNIQAAFIAGLAEGFDKVLLFLQDGEEPVPIDYRDLVTAFLDPSQIDEAIGEFAPKVIEATQQAQPAEAARASTILESVTFGASAAENEFRVLSSYYLDTEQFHRAMRGEVRLVVGRKGAGKTAVFSQVRDRKRQNAKNIVLDLLPDGYQLLKFKELVLKFLGAGSLEHTITAFWEYLLLLEVCHKLLQKDQAFHMRDRRLTEPYRKLVELYQTDEYVVEGDFSERLSTLLQHITDDYQAKYGEETNRSLRQQDVTELLYRHDVGTLRSHVTEYLRFKDGLFILFDNIDKGWPTHGLTTDDIAIVRALIEATRKVERQLAKAEIDCFALTFLRNDVYELLVRETSDRGKEGHVALDWSDQDMLREMIRRRLIYSGMPDRPFEELWPQICVSHVAGEDSFQYLIERCLMRPRALIDLASHCLASAVNLGHPKIQVTDIEKGVSAFSSDLVRDIGFEISDVLPEAENVLYAFIGEAQTLPSAALRKLLEQSGMPISKIDEIIKTLLWYGVIGVKRSDGAVTSINDVNYEMPILNGIIRKLETSGVVYQINAAFVSALALSE